MMGGLDDLVDQALRDLEKDPTNWGGYMKCPTCGALPGRPCRTKGGRWKATAHDDRPFMQS